VQVRTVAALIRYLVLVAVTVVASGLIWGWQWAGLVAALGLALTGYRVVRNRQWARRFRFAEREEDLLVSQGVFSRTLTAFPYGRMQVVKVESGPMDRAFGLANVSLVTAGESGAIPGLETAAANALRDRLIARGEAQATPL
jgi:membrane protein YdbS with pleckstrin-like domain